MLFSCRKTQKQLKKQLIRKEGICVMIKLEQGACYRIVAQTLQVERLVFQQDEILLVEETTPNMTRVKRLATNETCSVATIALQWTCERVVD